MPTVRIIGVGDFKKNDVRDIVIYRTKESSILFCLTDVFVFYIWNKY